MMNLEGILTELQSNLAFVDLTSCPNSSGNSGEFLVEKLLDLKIKMYQEKGHARPHVHVDYGKDRHAASYSIPEGVRLAGSLSRKYDNLIGYWIQNHHQQLSQLWELTQKGEPNESVISLIRENS